MPIAPTPAHQAETTAIESSVDDLLADDMTAPGSFTRCRALFRRTRVSVERGATAVEYALMVGLVAVGIITAVSALREKTVDSLSHTAASTSGLIFDASVRPAQTFTVKYVRNDLGIGAIAAITAQGSTTPIGGTGLLTQVAGDTQFLANLIAPPAGIYEVKIFKSGVGSEVLESGRLRVE
jgi:Flp pilus assembly pilin Flp